MKYYSSSVWFELSYEFNTDEVLDVGIMVFKGDLELNPTLYKGILDLLVADIEATIVERDKKNTS